MLLIPKATSTGGLINRLTAWLCSDSRLARLGSFAETWARISPRTIWTAMIFSSSLSLIAYMLIEALEFYFWIFALVLTGAYLHFPFASNLWIQIKSGQWLAWAVYPVLVLALVSMIALRYVFQSQPGLKLSRRQCPGLYDLVDQMASGLDTTIDEITLCTDFNCGVTSLATFSGDKHCLYIGYAALNALSSDEFTAILAHEMAHLKLGHSTPRSFVQPYRDLWRRKLEQWRTKRPFYYLLCGILSFWYLPVMDTLALAASRRQELEADRLGCTVVQTDKFARGLLSFCLKQEVYQLTFYDHLNECVERSGSETSRDTSSAGQMFRDSAKIAASKIELSLFKNRWQALRNEKDEFKHTHPGLFQRLQHLGLIPQTLEAEWEPDWTELLDETAPKAMTLLGEFALIAEDIISTAVLQSRQGRNFPHLEPPAGPSCSEQSFSLAARISVE